MYKYPRTHHLEGSRLQPGDEDLESVPFSQIAGRSLVVEEKIDGANSAISFSKEGKLLLQSREHYLRGGRRERHFDLFKTWASTHAAEFHKVLGHRYVLYGEWVYAKHTVFYNHLPHYFLEFDLLDTQSQSFLSTPHCAKILEGLPIASVPVVYSGKPRSLKTLTKLITQSSYIQPDHLAHLSQLCRQQGLDGARALAETDPSPTMEGLYIKVEENGVVSERYKYIRASFLQAVLQSGSHWLQRPIIPNQLAPGVSLW